MAQMFLCQFQNLQSFPITKQMIKRTQDKHCIPCLFFITRTVQGISSFNEQRIFPTGQPLSGKFNVFVRQIIQADKISAGL